MWWSYLLNVFMGILILITMLFCIGDLNDAVTSPTPYLSLFNNTGSVGVAMTLMIILFLLILSGNVTALATTSREAWAFSRDQGFPFSKWISRVSPLQILQRVERRTDGSLNNIDELQAQRPRQRGLPHLRRLRCHLPHKPRINNSLQHCRLPDPARSSLNIHDLHRLRPAQAYPKTRIASSPMEPR